MKHEQTASHDIQVERDDVAYIKLPDFERSGKISKTVPLRELVENYNGSEVMLDFSESGFLVGIEILG